MKEEYMRIAIASGKGGTGKTTVAVSLALAANDLETGTVAYVDCDVEEPNGHIFLAPDIRNSGPVELEYPIVDQDTCISCGKCAEICRFKAIIMLADEPYVTPDLCHACGGCWLVCPVKAVNRGRRTIGVIETGNANGITFVQGRLDIGQALSPPVIRSVKHEIPEDGLVLVDSPPGTSCPVITSIHGADILLLVTEPTPFGLNDLKLAVEMADELKIPYVVFINRDDVGDDDTRKYCATRHIPVIATMNDDRAVAEAYADGTPPYLVSNEYKELFQHMLATLKKMGRPQ
jgi:MinD superfamily P-loop ATPase